jgi:hypothetical protein
MKKNLLFFIAIFFANFLFSQSFTEGTDLSNTGTGPAFTVSGPSITIAGQLNTPGDGQDRFQIIVPAGCMITSVTYSITDNANIGVNGFAQFGTSNQQATPPLSGSFTTGPTGAFPVGPGTYDCMMVANIAANDSWSMIFNTSCTTGIASINSENPVSVFPNPFISFTTFQLNSTISVENASFELFDVLGQKVISQKIENPTFEIERKNLIAGIYFWTIKNGEKIISSGKIIAE